jgi:6-phosphogluconolactonase
MNLRIFDTLDDLVHAAARSVVQKAAAGGEPFRIALPGGSTPPPMYELLGSSPLAEQLAGRRIDWIVGDERCVPMENPQSNAGMIERTLFANGMSGQHRFLRFRTELSDPAFIADDFEEQWRSAGIERLDLAIQGIGDDGHTASLFPGTPALDVRDRVATSVYVPRLDSWRVTLTMPVLQAAGSMIVLAAGASKRDVIAKIRAGATDYPIVEATAPVQDCWWFADREAVPAASR